MRQTITVQDYLNTSSRVLYQEKVIAHLYDPKTAFANKDLIVEIHRLERIVLEEAERATNAGQKCISCEGAGKVVCDDCQGTGTT